jgi:hypothetical protein
MQFGTMTTSPTTLLDLLLLGDFGRLDPVRARELAAASMQRVAAATAEGRGSNASTTPGADMVGAKRQP